MRVASMRRKPETPDHDRSTATRRCSILRGPGRLTRMAADVRAVREPWQFHSGLAGGQAARTAIDIDTPTPIVDGHDAGFKAAMRVAKRQSRPRPRDLTARHAAWAGRRPLAAAGDVEDVVPSLDQARHQAGADMAAASDQNDMGHVQAVYASMASARAKSSGGMARPDAAQLSPALSGRLAPMKAAATLGSRSTEARANCARTSQLQPPRALPDRTTAVRASMVSSSGVSAS